MKHEMHHSANGFNQALTVIPIVRLDSMAVKIPVEMVDKIPPAYHRQKGVLRIKITKSSFCAWR